MGGAGTRTTGEGPALGKTLQVLPIRSWDPPRLQTEQGQPRALRTGRGSSRCRAPRRPAGQLPGKAPRKGPGPRVLPLPKHPHQGRLPLDGEQRYQRRRLSTCPSLGTGLTPSREPLPTLPGAQAPVDQSPVGPWGACQPCSGWTVHSVQPGGLEVGGGPGAPTEAGWR